MSAKEDWLFQEANNAAYDLGLRMERIGVLVSRLDEEGMGAACLDQLGACVLSDRSSYSSPTRTELNGAAGRACKSVWLRFLREHGQELREGKSFRLADPALPCKELFPGFTFFSDLPASQDIPHP